MLTGYEDAAHEHGTRAGRANDASGVPRKGQAPSRRRHGPRVRHAGVREGGGEQLILLNPKGKIPSMDKFHVEGFVIAMDKLDADLSSEVR